MLEGINYWDELKDSPSQMETCFAIFANVLELDVVGQPVNEKYAGHVLPPGSTDTARGNFHPVNPTLSPGRQRSTDGETDVVD
jgi:hypothetical protein